MLHLTIDFIKVLALAYGLILAWYGVRSFVRYAREKRTIKRDKAGAWVFTRLRDKDTNLPAKNNEKKEINTL